MNGWQTFLAKMNVVGNRIKLQRMIIIKAAFPKWINERKSRLPVSCNSTAIAGTTCYVSRDTNVELRGLQPIARFLHWSRQEVRSLFRQSHPMGQMSICSMSSTPIRTSGKIIKISAQNRDIYLLQIYENTDIRKSQQELKGWRMCSCTYPALWTLSWAAKAGLPANIHRTLVYQRHSFRKIFVNVTNALRNKALGEVFFIFL